MKAPKGLHDYLPPTYKAFHTRTQGLEASLAELKEAVLTISEQSRNEIAFRESFSELATQLNLQIQQLSERLSALQATQTREFLYANAEYLAYATRKQAPRILLAGWYGADNCGDELMLRALLKRLAQVNIRPAVLLWDSANYDAQDLSGFADIIHYPQTIWQLEQLPYLFDTLIWGGGALLDEHQYVEDPFDYNTGNLFIRLSTTMLDHKKQVYGIGLSTNNKLSNPNFCSKLSNIINRSTYFSLRDSYSLELCKQLPNVDKTKLSLGFDLVFTDPDAARVTALPSHVSASAHINLGLILMNDQRLSKQNALILKEAAQTLTAQDKSFEITLIPFFDFAHSDYNYFINLTESLNKPDWLTIAPFSRDLKTNAILNCTHIVSYRYHGALLAALAEKPSLFICWDTHPHYKNKMQYLSALFNSEDALLFASQLTPSVFQEALNKMLAGNIQPKLPSDLLTAADQEIETLIKQLINNQNGSV